MAGEKRFLRPLYLVSFRVCPLHQIKLAVRAGWKGAPKTGAPSIAAPSATILDEGGSHPMADLLGKRIPFQNSTDVASCF